jgi:phospholipid/cholesterol/gamma-HCH transport system substrate-binding protein
MRNRGPATPSIVGSPIMIGSVTLLILVIAVFLSYNANSGLPFVPTYRISAQVPDAAGLVQGNEVRIGGKRVGTIDGIQGKTGGAEPYAELELKLDKPVEPLLDDSRVTVRPRSPLGLKYLELIPGTRGEPVQEGGRLSLAAARESVELDQVFDTFDQSTRRSLQRTIGGLGTGLAGRGIAFNESVADGPELALRAGRVFHNLADPATRLRRAVRALAKVTGELAPVAPQLGSVFDNGNTTLAAMAGVRSELQQVLSGLPPTELIATEALRTARPVLADTRQLLRDLRPGIDVLPRSAAELDAALDRGYPVLRRARRLVGDLDDALAAVDDLARDPATLGTLGRLRTVLDSSAITLPYVVPMQTVCNYLGLWFRNAASANSEGDASGTWLRTLVLMGNTDEILARADPAPNLHVNNYPNAGGPGTGGDCEAGNEPFQNGQTFGNLPGVQATRTEDTGP